MKAQTKKQKKAGFNEYDRHSSDNRYNIDKDTSGQVTIIDTTKDQPEKYKEPIVYFTPNALRISHYIVEKSSKEVAWMALTKRLDSGDILITDEIFIPKQEATSTDVTITENAMMDMALEILETHDDTSTLLAHFHSHVNMACYPSAQDNAQIEEYFDSMPPYFVRGIFNKKGDIRVDVFFPNSLVGFNTVVTEIMYPGDDPDFKNLDKILKDNVTERYYSPTAYDTYGNWRKVGSAPSETPTQSVQSITTDIVEYQGSLTNDYYGTLEDEDEDALTEEELQFEAQQDLEDEKKSGVADDYGIGWDVDTILSNRPDNWEQNEDYLFEAKHDPTFFDYYNTNLSYGTFTDE